MSGRKDDWTKLRYDLIPFESLAPLVRVLMFGARKYGDHNWQKVPDARRRYFSAMMRHTIAWAMGEERDPESGESHMTHALCCGFFIVWFEEMAKRETVKNDEG